MRLWETPVLIPNTMVKTLAADGTLLETARESRWLPDHIKSHTVTKAVTKVVVLSDCMAVRKCSLKTEYRDQTILNILKEEVKTSEVTKLISLGYRNNKQL